MLLIFIIFFVSVNLSYPLERVKYVMGIPVSVTADNKDVFPDVFGIFKKVDRYFSLYRSDSVLCKLNRKKQLVVDSFFRELLEKSVEIYRQTDGFMDVSIGNITAKFGTGFQPCRLPHYRTYGMENVIVHNEKIELKNGISLDFGAVGKGFAVDKAVSVLRGRVKKAVINASGEIRCIGRCRVFIKNPFSEGNIAYFETVLQETGITTSGRYERFYKGKSHIINPKSESSVNSFVSVTLFSDTENVYLDGYATAVSVMPEEKAVEFLNGKRIGFIIIKESGCYLKGEHNSRYIRNLTFFRKLVECEKY
ncbi:MAG: FAD:protein FMN transferase [Persephonella sp.]|nr:FAD:protein FMN transferase [Persephonella sp.]